MVHVKGAEEKGGELLKNEQEVPSLPRPIMCRLTCCRRWGSNPSGKCSSERPTRGTLCGAMRSMCGADAGCLAMNYQSLLKQRYKFVNFAAGKSPGDASWNETALVSFSFWCQERYSLVRDEGLSFGIKEFLCRN